DPLVTGVQTCALPISDLSDSCRCTGRTSWLGWRGSQAKDLASPGEDLLMLTQQASPAPATAEVSGASRKLRQLLRKRLRQLLRGSEERRVGNEGEVLA